MGPGWQPGQCVDYGQELGTGRSWGVPLDAHKLKTPYRCPGPTSDRACPPARALHF
jgi:hypothetical protein